MFNSNDDKMSEISDLDIDEDIEKEVEKLMAEDEFKDTDFNLSQKTNLTKGLDSKDYFNENDTNNIPPKDSILIIPDKPNESSKTTTENQPNLDNKDSNKDNNQNTKSLFDDDFNIDDMDMEIDAELEAEIAKYLETEDFDLGMDDDDFKINDNLNNGEKKDESNNNSLPVKEQQKINESKEYNQL